MDKNRDKPFGGMSREEFWAQMKLRDEEDIRLLGLLVQRAVERGWTLFNHINGTRSSAYIFNSFAVTERFRVKVLRIDSRRLRNDKWSEHSYAFEQVLFEPGRGFLASLCGDKSNAVAHQLLDLLYPHEQIAYLVKTCGLEA